MINTKRCIESGQVYFKAPWWAKPDEKFRSGNRVTCSCGKTVKLRMPMNGGSVYSMVPTHNMPQKPDISDDPAKLYESNCMPEASK